MDTNLGAFVFVDGNYFRFFFASTRTGFRRRRHKLFIF